MGFPELISPTKGRNTGLEIHSDPISLLSVSVAEAKVFLSVNHSEHDSMIEGFIRSATRDIEEYTRRSIEQRPHVVSWKSTNTRLINIPRPPHVSIDSVTNIDEDGTETTLTLNEDYFIIGEKAKSIKLAHWHVDALRINYTSGYGLTEADIPQGIKTAVKWQLKLYYNNRNTGQDDFVQVDRRSGLVVQAKASVDDFVYNYVS